MNRRQFLHLAALATIGCTSIGKTTLAFASASSSQNNPKRLIVVLLRGAADGLSIVVPYGESAYYRNRDSIALARPGQTDGLIDLDGHFGLHPALAALQPLWQAGQLGFVHASGSPDPTRSHFDAQDYMESGTPGRKSTPDGWLNRLLTTLPGVSNPTRALCLGPTQPRILAGTYPVSNMETGKGALKPQVLDRPAVASAFAELYSGKDKLSQTYQESRQSHEEIRMSMADEMMAANNGAPMPDGFPGDARRLGALMRKDANIQIAFVALGGWDTHINQGNAKGQLASRLAPLGDGLHELATALDQVWQDTVVVVMSEFGRTVRQNGTSGTDHGHGNVMWLLGGGIHGGKMHGQWPGLDESALYQGRDLAITSDYRNVLAGLIGPHLRLPDQALASVFPSFHASGMASLLRA